jgi:undecaprenyl-diphosphatase
MAALSRSTIVGWATDRRVLLWAATAVVLGVLLTLLTVSIKNNPFPAQDLNVRDSILGWDVPGLVGFFDFVSFLTAGRQAFVIGIASVGFLWLIGMSRAALAFGIVGIIIGVVAVLGDFTLGKYVDRVRPEAAASTVVSYPSGHVFSTVVFFGFWAFLGVYYRVKRPILVPLVLVAGALISTVGLSRIFVGDHWPSDVAAGYLLGGIWLLLLVPLFLRIQRVSWWGVHGEGQDLDIIGCEHCRTERSIASEVILDPVKGTATKVYRPPDVVRLLYWWGQLRRRASRKLNIHSPLVMAVSLLPAVGAIAYLTARPLRQKPLGRVMVDQIASKLPLRL